VLGGPAQAVRPHRPRGGPAPQVSKKGRVGGRGRARGTALCPWRRGPRTPGSGAHPVK
jgi:hypothetical protein